MESSCSTAASKKQSSREFFEAGNKLGPYIFRFARLPFPRSQPGSLALRPQIFRSSDLQIYDFRGPSRSTIPVLFAVPAPSDLELLASLIHHLRGTPRSSDLQIYDFRPPPSRFTIASQILAPAAQIFRSSDLQFPAPPPSRSTIPSQIRALAAPDLRTVPVGSAYSLCALDRRWSCVLPWIPGTPTLDAS